MLDIQKQSQWDLKPLLNPKSVAIVGASEKSFYGMILQRNLKHFGYGGKVYPVSKRYRNVLGIPAYPSLTSLPKPPDNVVIIVRRELVIDVVREAISIGAKSATIVSAGFGETDEEAWKRAEEELKSLSLANSFPILGPNCLGAMGVHQRFGGIAAPFRGGVIPGNIALIMQSGGLLVGMCLPFFQRGIGLSYAISSGNNLCLDISDYIEYLLYDEHTDVICAYIEGIRKPDKFRRVVKKASEIGKPIIILKVGKSEKAIKATLAHTGSLAGSDNIINTMFEKYGVIRVSDFDELVETAAIFSYKKSLDDIEDNAGIGIMTGSGGAVGLINDLAEEYGINIAELSNETTYKLTNLLPPSANVVNPVDATGQTINDMDMYRNALQVLSDDPNVGIIINLLPLGLPSKDTPQHQKMLNHTVEVANILKKPVVLNSINSHSLDNWQKSFLESHKQVGFTQGIGNALKAAQSLLDYSKYRENIKSTEENRIIQSSDMERRKKAIELLRKIDGKVLTEYESKQIFSLYNVPISVEHRANNEQEALQAAENIGYPIVMKLDSPDILHKSDAGGVRTNLKNKGEVIEAYQDIMCSAKKYKTNAIINGVLIQEMISDGTEVIIGVSRDEQFGPTIMFGIGGIFVEVFKDSVFKLPPLSRDDAMSMIQSIKGYSILDGARGSKKKDIEALVDTLLNISTMTIELEDYINEMDINPLFVMEDGKGIKAVDGLIVLR